MYTEAAKDKTDLIKRGDGRNATSQTAIQTVLAPRQVDAPVLAIQPDKMLTRYVRRRALVMALLSKAA